MNDWLTSFAFAAFVAAVIGGLVWGISLSNRSQWRSCEARGGWPTLMAGSVACLPVPPTGAKP